MESRLADGDRELSIRCTVNDSWLRAPDTANKPVVAVSPSPNDVACRFIRSSDGRMRSKKTGLYLGYIDGYSDLMAVDSDRTFSFYATTYGSSGDDGELAMITFYRDLWCWKYLSPQEWNYIATSDDLSQPPPRDPRMFVLYFYS
jgi:hypothetical protein